MRYLMEIISSIKDIIALITGAATVVIAILVYRNTQKGHRQSFSTLKNGNPLKAVSRKINIPTHSKTGKRLTIISRSLCIKQISLYESMSLKLKANPLRTTSKIYLWIWKYQIFPPHPQNAMSISDLIIWYTILIFSLLVTIISVVWLFFIPLLESLKILMTGQ